MAKIPGYAGQYLEIDLTARKVNKIPLDQNLARNYIGGRAMGGKMLLDAYGANWGKVDPLSPEALLIFNTGPFAPFVASRMNVVFKSPLTNGIVGSHVSGDFHAEMRFSGYDGITVKGKASSPVYITVFDDKVEIKDASKWWGKETKETMQLIMDEYGHQTSQLYIAPGGENLVKYACVMADWYRAAGRGGGGAVMGSKNLKAIISKGTGPAPDVADQAKVNALQDWSRLNSHVVGQSRHEYGTTAGIYTTGNVRSSEPVKNWQSEWHDQVQIRGEFFAAEQWVRRYWADMACTVACSKLGRVKYGKRAGQIAELPDYESGALEGTNFGVYDISDMVFLTDLPDRYGLDLISLGNVCGWACEAQEKGILTKEDLGGVQLKWGEADGFAKLMELIAYRKGEIPTLLGEGELAASKKIGKGSDQFAVTVKGLELGAHGSRSLKDKDELGYVVSAHGGDHGSTVIADREDSIFKDSSGVCSFLGLTRDQEVELLQATTGFGITKDEVEKQLLYRWTTMMRIPLLLAGWTYKDDVNPPRFYTPLPDGPFKGQKVDKTIEETKKQAYYKAQGWDTQGVPTADTLKKYGFEAFEASLAPLRAKA